jgi:hypothetical protein
MPWDRSPDNHLTAAQRRDYLMASLGWFRDLLMLVFSLLLLVITGLLATDSGFAVSPMVGSWSVLPVSLIIIATFCMMWTLRHWTTMSYRRALLSLVISLAVAWVVALGCIEGIARRDGVFLRTAKAGGRRTVFTAMRLARVETILAVALYVCVGLLAGLRHRPWLLIVIVVFQATVYICGPIAAMWNLRAQAVPGPEYQRRFADRRLRAARRRRAGWAPFPRPAAAALTALCVGGVTSAFVFPVPLLHATTAATRGAAVARAGSPGTQVYVMLGSSAYYPVTSAHLSDRTLSFDTSSLLLLGEVLQAAADGGHVSQVSLAFRAPGAGGHPAAETFSAAVVTSFEEHLSGPPSGRISLLLPGGSGAAGTRRDAGPFSGPPASGPARVDVTMEPGGPSYAVTAVTISQAASGAPLDLSFTTSALPLLDGLFQGLGAAIPVLTLSVRSGARGLLLTRTFSGLSVGSFAEKRSTSLSGTATLVVPPAA